MSYMRSSSPLHPTLSTPNPNPLQEWFVLLTPQWISRVSGVFHRNPLGSLYPFTDPNFYETFFVKTQIDAASVGQPSSAA